MSTFRNIAEEISPPRLVTFKAVRMVYSFIGVPLDTIAEASEQASLARFPMSAPEDALVLIGRDRGIVRGPNEPSISYRQRLLLWLEAWKGAGVGGAMLDQIAGFITPATARIRIWTQLGVVYTREVDGTLTIEHVDSSDPTAGWNWDNRPDLWARFWLVIYSLSGGPWTREPVLGTPAHYIGERIPTGGSIGSSATVSDVESIRSIVNQWKPAASKCPYIMVAFDAAAFAPTDSAPPLPNGTWAEYWDSATLAAHRDTRAIYWKGV